MFIHVHYFLTLLKDGQAEKHVDKLFKTIRVVTVAPFMGFLVLTIIYLANPAAFSYSLIQYLLAILFITVLPLLAYPLQPFIPKFKERGRTGQRDLAIITAFLGYIGGLITVICGRVSSGLWLIYLTYFISGLSIFVSSKILKIKASGHACGIAGPIVLLVYFFGPIGLLGLPVLFLAFYASIKMKRHSVSEFISGSLISLVGLVISMGIISLL